MKLPCQEIIINKRTKNRADSNATCSKQKFKQVCQRNLRLYAYKLILNTGSQNLIALIDGRRLREAIILITLTLSMLRLIFYPR